MSGRREKYRAPSAGAVTRMLTRLLPPGPIWATAGVAAIVSGLAGTWSRVMGRVADLLREMRGGQAVETLAEWERELGLPVCPPGPVSDADRRAAIAAALAGVGGQTPAYFIALALAAGAVVTIEEGPTAPYTVPECGVMQCGDELASDRARYIWRVTFAFGTTAEADALVRCLFERHKPAHTLIEWRIGPAPDGYLACNGTVWAEAAGAMTGIATPWTRVVVWERTGVAWAGSLDYRVGMEDGLTWEFSAADDHAFSGTDDESGGPRSVAASSAGNLLWASDSVDGSGSGGPLSADNDVWIGRGFGPSISDAGTRIYADLVIAGTPTVTQLRALLTTPPWQVFAPATILRCYLPALATVDFPDVIIPDVARQVGGPLAPVNAVMRAGGLETIVIT